MAEPVAQAGLRTDERRNRRQVSVLLNHYYAIEGSGESSQRGPHVEALQSELDRQGFDAKRYFDGVVASGHLPELVTRTENLQAEVQEMDGTMQTLVYENYSKFIRATDVIRQMKATIEGLTPDFRSLEGGMARATEHQDRAERGVTGRAVQLDHLLRQQKICRKLQALFGLPRMLQSCLAHSAYAQAVEAYRCCVDVLRQHKDVPAFRDVLEEVDLHMARIRDALESRLRCPELPVEEAVGSGLILINLSGNPCAVAQKYVVGRSAMLRQSCKRCFTSDACPPTPAASSSADAPTDRGRPSGAATDEGAPESQEEQQPPCVVTLSTACSRAAELHAPCLCAAAQGLWKLQREDGPAEGGLLLEFVERQAEELFHHISELVALGCPPTPILVECIHSVQDSLQGLQQLLPNLLAGLFAVFTNRIASNAVEALFSSAAASLVRNLSHLHSKCESLQECDASCLNDLLEEIARSEESNMRSIFTALTDCQPLLGLLASDRHARRQFIQVVHVQLITLFLVFVEACLVSIGQDLEDAKSIDLSLPVTKRVAQTELGAFASLGWSGLFGLALVRIGRHLEVKVIASVWDIAKGLFAGGDFTAAEFKPHPALLKATRTATQAVLTHYVLVNGHGLASALGDSMQSCDWATLREPRIPRPVFGTMLKEVNALDAQLARILGDPRKAREASHQRRSLDCLKNSMELEMERLWVRKLQVFAPIPFNRNGAILGILRIAFKALYEHVRERTFTKSGLQQMQVDCAYLLEAVRDFVEAEDGGVLDSLLDEAVTSASKRCIEPELLDPSVVETLCDEAKRRDNKPE